MHGQQNIKKKRLTAFTGNGIRVTYARATSNKHSPPWSI